MGEDAGFDELFCGGVSWGVLTEAIVLEHGREEGGGEGEGGRERGGARERTFVHHEAGH